MKKVKVPPILEVYEDLYDHFGPQSWWPGRTRLEVCVGAILTQNTAWTHVEKAIRRLKKERALTLERLHAVDEGRLATWLTPVGYHRLKARRVKAFISMVAGEFHGQLNELFKCSTPDLRKVLLGVKGIGPETADCILLYAAKRPVFVVDAYTQRFMRRHGWLGERDGYEQTAELFLAGVPEDTQVYNEYHALIVMLGKTYCRPTPQCERCPLRPRLPPGGPRG